MQSGWEIVCDYYQHVDSPDWVPYAVMNVQPLVAASGITHDGKVRLARLEMLSLAVQAFTSRHANPTSTAPRPSSCT